MRWFYLAVAVLGTVLPYSSFLPFLGEHGVDVPLFVQQLFANHISTFFGWDVIVSSLALWAFVFTEGRRLGMKRLWVYVGCNLLVGVSLALPLFLWAREPRLARD